ncbi:beta-N-acetylhexosaminidase [Paenibacillus macquariensis]|uniref:Glycosyl hydrolase family 20, catalytic domain n=1 Tax=Paenibacillus macquariensis TaxID=948756 RepID=A0ABY1K2V5_9BACL|nr:beta-N-acetylhexosaminidase [Paenibacillus macquariensis]MEC0090254.1 beta-N-acetylhexosaminidase [Paenibacillus macquariensis]OAB39616.1 glycoside hydrolase [Paenibacillus macquariensis subsp. macquariensis]SIR18213.1 Glycosyl hydrolase family 20, catalytic domain [Paenibacillus macquariensis]
MKLCFEGDLTTLTPGIQALSHDLGFFEADGGLTVKVKQSTNAEELVVGLNQSHAYIHYGQKHQFFRGLGLLLQHSSSGEPFELQEKQQFDTIGPMFDLSRNAVLTVDSFKFMLNKMALMGLNTVMLYMEDTYAIEGEPYFGYMRGRYTHAELKEIDDYADQFGIEAFPSIQTLAHLEEFLKWQPVSNYKDTKGALLVGKDLTDLLVEKMIEASSAPFRSRKIHIGMDEAEELGRGKYLDYNGYRSRFDIMTEHLEKVLDCARGRGLKPMMWSDMFLKLASENSSEYYDKDTQIPEEMARKIPQDVDMVYWDYVHTEKEEYEDLIAKHRKLGNNLVFAGAVWIFNTFGVNYGLSLNASDTALQVCKQEGIREVYATMWGDDGNESNPFIALLGLQLYAEHAYSEEKPDQDHLAARVKFCTGIDADTFQQLKNLDETPGAEPNNQKQSNPSKFLLYQDVLLGLFDKQIEGLDMAEHYVQVEQDIRSRRNKDAELDYLFEVPEKLCGVLKRKSEIGIELKRAYDTNDNETLRHIATEALPAISEAVRELRIAHRSQWLRMFKPFGWEVIDIRYGGVVNRLDTATYRILDYVEGKINRIEELEQERLLYSTTNRFTNKGAGWCSYYYRMASPNVFFHIINPF